MSDPKIINGRMDIYPNTPPKPPSHGSHISPEVRKALDQQIPEIRRGVLDVAGRK